MSRTPLVPLLAALVGVALHVTLVVGFVILVVGALTGITDMCPSVT